MKNFLKDKRVILLAALLALAALVVLGSALKDVTFQPARQLSQPDSDTIRISIDEVVNRIVEVPVWKQVVFWILLFFFILLISALLSPEMRKRLLLGFLRFTLFVVLFLYIMKKNPEIFQGLLALGSLGSGSANPFLLKDMPPPIFEPPHISGWFSFLVTLVIILLTVLAVWRINRWWIRRNELLATGHPLKELTEIARTSLQELLLGNVSSHDVIVHCYIQMSRVANETRGVQRDFAMTPSEFTERLEKAGLPGEPVGRLTNLFESVRYGAKTFEQRDVEEAVSCLTLILKYCGEAGMTRRYFILAGAFLVAMVIAFTLRDVVEWTIITPLAYLWWVLKLYYSVIPQYILWIVLTLVFVFSAISSLLPAAPMGRGSKPDRVIIQGQIAGLADWLNKSKRGGVYYKWLIANRLGKDAREILAQRDGHAVSKKIGRLNGNHWHPPQEIDSYLESGLNGSFADYPRPRLGTKPQHAPLDVNPQLVIDYLENEMERLHDSNHKGI